MTGSTISIEVDDKQISDLFNRLIAFGADPEEPLLEIGEALLASHQDRFDAGVDPDGNPWEPLSPKYAKRKEKKRPGKGILVYDELLSLLNYRVDGDELAIGTNRIYAATHQFGDESRGIPQREFLGFSDEDIEEAREILAEHLQRLIDG